MPAGGDTAVEVVELVAGRLRLRFGGGPVAAEPHDLRAVNAARTRKAGDVELVAPPVRRLRPLGRAPVVAEIAARADRKAVDETGRVRPQATGDCGRGRLVQQRKTLLDPTGLDARAPYPGERQYLHVAVANALRELGCALEEPLCSLEVSLGEHGGDGVGE